MTGRVATRAKARSRGSRQLARRARSSTGLRSATNHAGRHHPRSSHRSSFLGRQHRRTIESLLLGSARPDNLAATVNDVLILCYHAVSDRWPASLSVTPERLESQLAYLVRSGYRGVTFTRAVVDPPGGRVLAVTFDDGFRSVVRLAQPVMERLGVPGTVFVATSHVGTERPMAWQGLEQWVGTEHEQELVAATWPELNGLRHAGWEIGAHTRTHPHLTQIDEASIYEELAGSRRDVEENIGPCTSLAYPYGDHDGRVVAAAAKAGFRAAATLPTYGYRPEALRRARVYVGHRDDARRFRLKVSRPLRVGRVAAGMVAAGASAGSQRFFSRGV